MKTHKKLALPLLLGFVLTVAFSGCGGIGMMVSQNKTFAVEQTYAVGDSVSDPLKLAQQAGQLLGMNVAEMNKEVGTLVLTSSQNLAMITLIGKNTQSMIRVQADAVKNELTLNVSVSGNFGTGTEDAAQELLNKYVAKLNELKD